MTTTAAIETAPSATADHPHGFEFAAYYVGEDPGEHYDYDGSPLAVFRRVDLWTFVDSDGWFRVWNEQGDEWLPERYVNRIAAQAVAEREAETQDRSGLALSCLIHEDWEAIGHRDPAVVNAEWAS